MAARMIYSSFHQNQLRKKKKSQILNIIFSNNVEQLPCDANAMCECDKHQLCDSVTYDNGGRAINAKII